MKGHARRLGISVEEYEARASRGEKRCTGCCAWKRAEDFGLDGSRGDGRAARCLACRRVPERKSTKGRESPFRGHAHSPESRALMSAAHRGKPSGRLGKTHTLAARAKISSVTRARAVRGSACRGYIDGKGGERRGLRFCPAYKRWRYDVYLRDGFACQHCRDGRGGNLNAHHVKPFATHPDLRLVVSNGITLCERCHTAFHAGDAAVAQTIALRCA